MSDIEQDVPNTQGAGLPSTESDDFIIFDKAKNQGSNQYAPRQVKDPNTLVRVGSQPGQEDD